MARYHELVRQAPILATWQRADEQRLSGIQAAHPRVPADYLDFLKDVGFGRSEYPSFRLYGGLSSATEVYGLANPELAHVLLFGDDYQGFTSGFNAQWEVVQLDSADGPIDVIFNTFEQFITNLFSL